MVICSEVSDFILLLFQPSWPIVYTWGMVWWTTLEQTSLKALAGAISAPLKVLSRNMGHEEAFILNPGGNREADGEREGGHKNKRANYSEEQKVSETMWRERLKLLHDVCNFQFQQVTITLLDLCNHVKSLLMFLPCFNYREGIS